MPRKYTPALRAAVHDDIEAGLTLSRIAKARRVPLGTVKRWSAAGRPEADAYQTSTEPSDDAGSSRLVANRHSRGEPSEPSRVRLTHDQLDDLAAPLARKGALRLLRYIAGEPEEVLEASPLPDDVWRNLSDDAKRALADKAWSPRDARSAAHALASLVDKIPDILSLHERTRAGGESGVDGDRGPLGSDELDAVQAALGEADDEEVD